MAVERLHHRYANPSGAGDRSYKYRISDFPTSTPSEARIDIARRLRRRSFAVNVNPIIKQDMIDAVGELDEEEHINAAIVTSGVVIANGYVDFTDNTYPILPGKPVVFDTVTGRAVTGINPKWSPEEYVIIGTAHMGLWPVSAGFGRVPIILGQHFLPDTNRIGVLTEDLHYGGQAEMTFTDYDPERTSLPIWNINTGTMIVHSPEDFGMMPIGKKLPSGSPVSAGLMFTNPSQAAPVWIFIGSPICPVDI